MSIASEITRLQNDSAAIASAIRAKGVTVPSGSGYDDYASLIGQISGGGGSLPYTPLEYIQTDGAAYINTGIIPTTDSSRVMGCDLKVKMNASISSAEIIVGTGKTDGNAKTFNFLYRSTGNQSKIGYGYHYMYSGVITPSGFANPFEVSTLLEYGACMMGCQEAGASTYITQSNDRNRSVAPGVPLYIFASNDNGSPARNASAGTRIYYIRISISKSFPNIVFDAVPCIYNNAYGLWDRVTNSFFGNAANSGSFTGQ